MHIQPGLHDSTLDWKQVVLRTVPDFATAHTFCAPHDVTKKLGFLTVVPAKTEIFLRGL